VDRNFAFLDLDRRQTLLGLRIKEMEALYSVLKRPLINESLFSSEETKIDLN
jgi:hypothetical protein